MMRVKDKEADKIKQTHREERARLLDQVTAIEQDIEGVDFDEVQKLDELS